MDQQINLAGVSTAVLAGGAGPPVVLLHSAGEFAALWLRVIPDLVRTHRVIAPDLPGHGASHPTGQLAAGDVLGWLGELIDRTCPQPPVVVGHGLGGAISARLACEQPHRFTQLVLVDALGLGEFAPAPGFAAALHQFTQEPTERTRDHLFGQCFTDLDRLGERWAPLAHYALDRARTPDQGIALASLLPEFVLPAIPPADLARIDVPTTLIWGRDDLQVLLQTAETASSRYGWPLYVIDNAGDDPPLEHASHQT
ncbi:MAG: alpha/beta fold hydrolase [Pseudonocardiaceae bacterium]